MDGKELSLLTYRIMAVALSAWDPKFLCDRIAFLCIKAEVTRLAPSAPIPPTHACRQLGSITNWHTSSYLKLSHTPSVANTIATVLLLVVLAYPSPKVVLSCYI